jgi:copper chaperone CopZ
MLNRHKNYLGALMAANRFAKTLVKIKVAFCCGGKLKNKLLLLVIISLADFCSHSTIAIAKQTPKMAASGIADTPQFLVNSRLQILLIRLRGSMCPSCLLRLENKLVALSGVIKAKVTADKSKYISHSQKAKLNPRPRLATVNLLIDQNKICDREVIEAIKQNDFDITALTKRPFRPKQKPQ